MTKNKLERDQDGRWDRRDFVKGIIEQGTDWRILNELKKELKA